MPSFMILQHSTWCHMKAGELQVLLIDTDRLPNSRIPIKLKAEQGKQLLHETKKHMLFPAHFIYP